MKTIGYLSLILAFVSSPVSAAEKMWNDLSDAETGVCSFAAIFEGPGETAVIVTQDQERFDDDTIVVIIANDNWSIKLGDTIKETIKVEAEDYSFWSVPTALNNGLALSMKTEHIDGFAKSYPSSVEIYKDKQVIDRLDFSGFASAYRKFEICQLPKQNAKKERLRLEAIEKLPKDPFAKK